VNLTRQERKAIFAGTLKVLRRSSKPDQEAGSEIVVSSTRGGRQVIDRETGKTVDLPRVSRLWITVKGWHLRAGQTEWETEITIHDRREDNRQLASGGIGGMQRPAGLKTRWGTEVIHRDGKVEVSDKHVPKTGEQRENWTPETERGYGGGGGRGLDERDSDGQVVPAPAVDDATLNDFARRIEKENRILRNQRRHDHRKMAQEARLARQRKERKLQAISAIKRRMEEADEDMEALRASRANPARVLLEEAPAAA
jgi:hypothetical protein